MRATLAVVAALGGILLFLLASASANTALFARHYPWLLGINAVAAAVLLAIVGFQLRRFLRDRRAGVFGVRLKARLLAMLALMAVLPGALVYAVSMQFAVKSIESWFDVRVDAALEGGLNLGRGVLDSLQADLLDKARGMALDLGDAGSARPVQLNRLREQTGAHSAVLLSVGGQVLATSSADLGALVPSMPSPTQLRQARVGRGLAMADSDAAGRLQLRALVPVTGSALGAEPRVLQLIQPVPESIARSAESVEAAYRDYQELALGKSGLKWIYTLTLTLALLLSLFAAVGLAFLLAERLAQPLLILAEGTRAVAAGDFTPRQSMASDDELGVLTRSFSDMTRQLADAREESETHRQRQEATQAYLESVLANLSAGVLAFDTDFRLRAANRGALAILRDDLAGFEAFALDAWPRHAELARAILAAFAGRGEEWQEQLELERADGVPQTLLVRGKRLPEAGGGGYVTVFDDISQLISAQRSSAWGEVARRLAHEIKNPLTPIQLSAERIEMKLAERLSGADREMLEKATRTIVAQVEAMKNMVNDFRDYARTPPPQLAAFELDALIREVLGLYESQRVQPAARLAGNLPPVLADPNQLRQVLHNLLANAQDALGEQAAPAITVSTALEDRRIALRVADNGPGFPPQILARAFEPYVTTKAKGTGLGLAIVKKIIDDHRGEIRLANADGGGAEITIRLPLAEKA